MFVRKMVILMVAVVVTGVAGCGGGGPDLVPVTGKVTYNGQPLEGASVTFVHSDGHLAVGNTDSSGEFSLVTGSDPGAVVGQHKVGIRKSATVVGMPADPKPEDMFRMGGGPKAQPAAQTVTPTKYENPDGSGLTAQVDKDAAKNNFTFDLTD